MRSAPLFAVVLLCSWQDEKPDAATKTKAKDRFAQLLREAAALHKKAEGDAKFRESAEFEKRSRQIGEELVGLGGTLGAADPDAIEALIEGIVRTQVPELVPELERQKAELLVTANEHEAIRALRAIAQAQDDMCLIDMDENGTHDYWVADVSGLNRMKPGDKVIQLISASIARADAKPCLPVADTGTFKASQTSSRSSSRRSASPHRIGATTSLPYRSARSKAGRGASTTMAAAATRTASPSVPIPRASPRPGS